MGQDVSQLGSAFEAAKSALHFEPSTVDYKDAATLPMEDGIWVIAVVDDPSEYPETIDDPAVNNHLRLMAIADEKGLIIGGSAKDERGVTLQKQAMDLLKQCLFAPIVWKPRRPRYLGFRNDIYFTELPLEDINIQKISMFTGTFGPDHLPKELEQRHSCTVCQKRGSVKLFEGCPKCEAVFYCSEQCRLKDYEHDRDNYSHRVWCDRTKRFKDFADDLAQMPFTFTKETTDSNFTDRKYKKFLEDHGVLNHGYWRWEYFTEDMPGFGALPDEQFPIGLPSEATTLEAEPSQEVGSLPDWKAYYDWRGFGMDSPIAILLQWPLTIYNILTTHVPKDNPDLRLVLENYDLFTIHLIGVEKEADFVGIFSELVYLFPTKTFHIVMVGSEIAQKVDKKEIQVHPRLKVTLVRALYHKYDGDLPDIVIGFNSGLAAYGSWVETLNKLKSMRVPAYMTDYCQYSCEAAKAPMEYLEFGTVTPAVVNPFRSPVRKHCEEHAMPWYSNGFVYRLIYNNAY